jgi:septum formation protein
MKNKTFKIILGSQSSSRKKILREMGYEFETMAADIDEKVIRFEDPIKLTLALANAKAKALLPKISARSGSVHDGKNNDERFILITSDQVVVCNGKIIEKPTDEKEVRNFIKMYEKYPAETVTSVVVVNTSLNKTWQGTDIVKTWIDPIPQDIIDKYIATNDPFFVAGGLAIENSLLTPYINHIDGELESVMGLPKKLTGELINLANLGL